VLLNEMFGARADYGGLRIAPCIPSEWKECSVERVFRGDTYRVRVRNPEGIEAGAAEITVDGEQLDGDLAPPFGDGGVHQVEVVIGQSPRHRSWPRR
jgi:cellobiose phosphorylase